MHCFQVYESIHDNEFYLSENVIAIYDNNDAYEAFHVTSWELYILSHTVMKDKTHTY